ncbi:transcriptional regulator [bacterium 1xD42-67]|nr:transcriptional regulator [bacterium 1xD42-67]
MKTNLRQARKDKGLTQQQLADRVYVTSRTIIALEKEEYNPSLMLAYRLSLALEVPMEELFDLRENKEKEDKKYEDL